MRTPIWLQVAGALLLQACALEVGDPPEGARAPSTTLDGEIELEWLEPDECPQKPGMFVETELEGLENPALDGDIPPVIRQLGQGPAVVSGEITVHPNNNAAKADEHYLQAYPHFDDCTLPGNYCWE
jgi:hypothetical protein